MLDNAFGNGRWFYLREIPAEFVGRTISGCHCRRSEAEQRCEKPDSSKSNAATRNCSPLSV